MKCFESMTAALLAASVACSGCSPGETGPAPAAPTECARVLEGERVHDLGLVPPSANFEHRFPLHNATEHALRLVDTHSSCGCSRAELDVEVIEPGGSAELLVDLTSRGQVGETRAYVDLELVDEAGSRYLETFELRCTVDVPELVFCDPGILDLGEVPVGGSACATVLVRSKSLSERAGPERVELAGAPRGTVSVDLSDLVTEGKWGRSARAAASIELAAGTEPGAVQELLVFELAYPGGRTRSVDLVVRARVVGALDPDCRSVFLGAVAVGELKETSFGVRVRGAVEEPELSTSCDWIEAAWRGPEGGGSDERDCDVVLRVRSPVAPGPFSGWVEVASAEEAHRIPVTGLVR